MLLGEVLVSQVVGEQDVKIALWRRGRIGDNLIALGVIGEERLNAALREQYERQR